MRILFNAEGNKNIGMGAFYNCTALAKGFNARLKPEIKFYISQDSEKNVEDMILKGYDVARINMGNAGGFLDSVKECNPDIIVQDILDLENGFMTALKGTGATVVNISHVSDFSAHLKADIVVNLLYDSKKVKCLHGPKYAILDSRFANPSGKQIKDKAHDLFMAFGGSDVNDLTLKLMKILDKLDMDVSVNVVMGPGFRNEAKVEETLDMLSNKKRFTLNRSVSNMPEFMRSSDLAFVSGGRIVCELAATGTPGVVFAQNELEHGRLKQFENWGSIINHGYYKDGAGFLAEIKNIILDKQARERMSRRGQDMVDGKGVDRIIEAVLEGKQ